MAEAELKAAAAALDKLVAESVQTATARARKLSEMEFEDSKRVADDIRRDIATRKGVLQAMTLLMASIKNAEGTLKKLESQSLKDAATLDELRKKGPGGEPIRATETFVTDIVAALKVAIQNAAFAETECAKFSQMISRDPNLDNAMGGRGNAQRAVQEVKEAEKWMETAQQNLKGAVQAMLYDFAK